MNTLLVLLGGPTCSGKTSVARAVCELLPHGVCGVVGLDAYYRDLAHLPFEQRAGANFDHPDAFDWDLLRRDIALLQSGQAAELPTYDFTSHVRGSETVTVSPTALLIVEGILALHDGELREKAALRIFLDTQDEECLQRRIARDTAERGRSEESVRAQFRDTVSPMAINHVFPTRTFGHLVIGGGTPMEEAAALIVAAIRSLSN